MKRCQTRTGLGQSLHLVAQLLCGAPAVDAVVTAVDTVRNVAEVEAERRRERCQVLRQVTRIHPHWLQVTHAAADRRTERAAHQAQRAERRRVLYCCIPGSCPQKEV